MKNTLDIQKDFPQIKRIIRGKPIVYLDSTATSLKPQSVIDKENEYYTKYTANIFRGIYTTSEEATQEYEDARTKVAAFIGATNPHEIVFTRNASESVNLFAYSYGLHEIHSGDHIVVSIMEHHSNFVPWQQLGKDRGWNLDIWRTTADGQLDLKALETLITKKTKVLAVTALSNVLGTITPIAKIVEIVKKINPDCLILVDAAQAAPHMVIDVNAWGADVVVFSSHKMLGPTGIGILWGKYELLERMQPFMYGGEMIEEVTEQKSLFKKPPHKFEAGTPHIAGVIGFGAAIDYLTSLGMDTVREHEMDLVQYASKQLARISGLTVYGPTDSAVKGGVMAFTLKGSHPHDIAQVLNEDNICIRSGNHCAMPLHLAMGLSATARASFYIYTTHEDIDLLVEGLEKVKKIFL